MMPILTFLFLRAEQVDGLRGPDEAVALYLETRALVGDAPTGILDTVGDQEEKADRLIRCQTVAAGWIVVSILAIARSKSV